MAKRPRFSRWRRLPPVFRTGENRPIGSGNELDRIILYLPSRLLDLAEALAEKAGIPAVQDYCSHLLARAIEAEQVQRKVAGFEARRGPLEGLKEIASDPGYLAEWQAGALSRNPAPPSPALPKPSEAITVDLVLADGDVTSMEPPSDEDAGEVPSSEPAWDPEDVEDGGDPPRVKIPTAPKPMVRVVNDRTAMEVLWRHVGTDGDESGFLPCLRRGAPVPAMKVSELIQALNQLEQDHRGATVLDRRMAHALHRLALESQVLLTDAWPGVFDDRMIAAIRAVQEAVERILSGEDIRYYSRPSQ